MDVTLKIEAHQLGDTIVDMFKSLSAKQKKSLAVEVMRKWLEEPYAEERRAYEESVLTDMRARDASLSSWGSDKRASKATDDEIRASSTYQGRMREYRSSREQMVSMIVEESVRTFKESVTQMVNEDEQLKESYERVRRLIEGKFPAMVQSAMTRWMCDTMQYAILNVPDQQLNLETEMKGVKEALTQIQGQIGQQT